MFESARAEQIISNYVALEADVLRHARDPSNPPRILPVTKTQSVEDILALSAAGVREIGENRVQEIVAKYPDLSSDFGFHLIGRLQTNKIKYIMGRVQMVHSLDREGLAQALDRHAQIAGLRMPVLVEVNIGQEAQKAGISYDEIEGFVRMCAGLPGIEVRGLMAMMPLAADVESLRPGFGRMRTAFERLQSLAVAGTRIDTLSMGMSADYRLAAQEGATVLRIGSALFSHTHR